MLGVIAHVPNEKSRFVAMPVELLSSCLTDVVASVKRALGAALGYEEEEDFRLLWRERDLDEDSASSFLKSLSAGGVPCAVRVLFRLLGGKGGFGALLRKQMGGGKKTTNFDAMRDLSGRRLRHSKAVERIKSWMEQQKRDDELVNLITGEGPDLPKAPRAEETLDPEYVRNLKRVAANRPGLVTAGLRALLEEEAAAAAEEAAEASGADGSAKRPRTAGDGASSSSAAAAQGGARGEAAGGFLSALDTLGGLSSSEAEDSGNEGANGKAASSQKKAPAAVSSSSTAACAAAAAADEDDEDDAAAAGADVDIGDVDDEEEVDETAQSVAAARAAHRVGSGAKIEERTRAVDGKAKGTAQALSMLLSLDGSSSGGNAEARASSRGCRRGAAPAAVSGGSEGAGKCLSVKDIAEYASADELAGLVPAEDVKQSLQSFGLKCGGAPKERAARLFLLKTTALGDLPKSAFPPKK